MGKDSDFVHFDHSPRLQDPILIAAFEGWNDGGTAATSSVRHMIKAFSAERFARIDPEEFYVFSENRPHVKFDAGNRREIVWQKNEFFHASLPGTGRDVVLFLGSEPNLRWRTFCANFVAVAKQLDVQCIVTLGAFLADVLYTLPVQLSGLSNQEGLSEKHKLQTTSYEGPTGIVGVLTKYCDEHQLPTLSLWAGVPYYISIPNPKASLAQLKKLQEIFAFEIDLSEIERLADSFDNEINDVVAKNPNVAAYVRELKKREFLN
ncbi:MAG: PAC2 family protein [Candidatus Lambdaproteobacteria bacterium]|nr:PAC2 family protein [Candidatus Lambdaproteobacteria bacterium]